MKPEVVHKQQRDIDLCAEMLTRISRDRTALTELVQKIEPDVRNLISESLNRPLGLARSLDLPKEQAALAKLEDLSRRSVGIQKGHQRFGEFVTELQDTLNFSAGFHFDDKTGTEFKKELSAMLKRFEHSFECHQCGEPATLDFTAITGSPSRRWRFVHGSTTKHKVLVAGSLKSVSNTFPMPLKLIPSKQKPGADCPSWNRF